MNSIDSINPKSRVVLLLLVTVIVATTCWVLLSIQNLEIATPIQIQPVWRYTDNGWIDISSTQANYVFPNETPLELLHPLFWAALQILAAAAVLVWFADENEGTATRLNGAMEPTLESVPETIRKFRFPTDHPVASTL